jgi:signal peptidase II
MRRNRPYLVLVAGLVALDQISKWLIMKFVPAPRQLWVVPKVFALAMISNKGAIFGMFSRMPGRLVPAVLTAASLVALALVVVYFIKAPSGHWFLKTSLSLILAGAVGNQIDRFVRGYVVDFLEVHIGQFIWPTFNVADSCISVGAVLLVALLVFRRA